MYNHVVECININNIIYTYQFGFRQKHSTNQASGITSTNNQITTQERTQRDREPATPLR